MFSKLSQLFKDKKNSVTYPKIAKPSYTGYSLLVEQSITALKTLLDKRDSPNPPILNNTNDKLLWGIKLKNHTDVIMQLNFDNKLSDEYQIIYVDAELLYLSVLILGLKPEHTRSNIYYLCKLREDLKKDDYYQKINQLIIGGKTLNLPTIYSTYTHKNSFDLLFRNGLEQTIWLIANYAESFPILVNKDSAETLNITIGLTDHPLNISDLANA